MYLSSAGQYADDQVEIFDKVLNCSCRVQRQTCACFAGAAVRQLARNDEISIAEPILKESAFLTAEDLVEVARLKGERHLLAIASRWWLKEVVTDVPLARHFPSVSRRIVNNPGAKVSAAGFAILVAKTEADSELAVETGLRVDLPPKLRDQLLRRATETVRARLLSRAPPHLFEEIRKAIPVVAAGAGRDMSKTYDFTDAAHFVAMLEGTGELSEGTLRSFAKQRRYKETIVALARLSMSRVEVVRPLMQSMRYDGILVVCKAAELGWDTVYRDPKLPIYERFSKQARIDKSPRAVRYHQSRNGATVAPILAGKNILKVGYCGNNDN